MLVLRARTHTHTPDALRCLFGRPLESDVPLVFEASKLKYSVNALGTVVEGPAAKVWKVCRTESD